MNVLAITLVILLTFAASAAMGLVTWGLVLEARSNREWRKQGLAR